MDTRSISQTCLKDTHRRDKRVTSLRQVAPPVDTKRKLNGFLFLFEKVLTDVFFAREFDRKYYYFYDESFYVKKNMVLFNFVLD